MDAESVGGADILHDHGVQPFKALVYAEVIVEGEGLVDEGVGVVHRLVRQIFKSGGEPELAVICLVFAFGAEKVFIKNAFPDGIDILVDAHAHKILHYLIIGAAYVSRVDLYEL